MPNIESPASAGIENRIERILCAVDFSELSAKAYRYAQSLARHYGAALIVQHVVDLWQHPCGYYSTSVQQFESFREKLLAAGQRELAEFVDTSGDIEPQCIVREGYAADEILSLARTQAVNLIVLGTHGRRGFDRLTFGSVTEQILRHAHCPVLAVRQTFGGFSNQDAADDSVSIRRVLCGVDFSPKSARALQYALSLAQAYDADLTVLRVLDETFDSSDLGKEAAATIENFEKLIPSTAHKPHKTRFAIRIGKAYDEIRRFAAEDRSDMIVIGISGHHALDLALLGSTTDRVIRLGPGPVLAVPI